MSDQPETVTLDKAEPETTNEMRVNDKDELTLLKQRANLMGISYSNSIGLDTLKTKIKDHLEKDEQKQQKAVSPNNMDGSSSNERMTAVQRRNAVRKEAMQLVRLRINNLDPKKRDLPGEIISVGNDYVGMIKKYIPFGEVTDNGYHVPKIIYNFLQGKKFLHIRSYTDKDTKQIRVEHNWTKEYSLEVLPKLTQDDLDKLAASQKAAGMG